MRGAGDRCRRRGRRRPPPPLRDGLRHARCNCSNCVFGCRAVRQTPDLWLGWEVFGQRGARCQSAIVGVLGASAQRPPPLRGLACHISLFLKRLRRGIVRFPSMSVCTALREVRSPCCWSPVQIAARCWALLRSAAGPSGAWRRSSDRAGCALGTQGHPQLRWAAMAAPGCSCGQGFGPQRSGGAGFAAPRAAPGRRRRARWAETLFFLWLCR